MSDSKILQPGLKGLIHFIDFLDKNKISYDLKRDLSSAISVWFLVVGAKFEVDFFEDRVRYNYYIGNEEVFDDEQHFLQMLTERWDLKE
jgi:hypothetical protein